MPLPRQGQRGLAALTRKNFSTIMEAFGFGATACRYRPPGWPSSPLPGSPTTLEYTPRRSAHSLIVRSAVLKVSIESTCKPDMRRLAKGLGFGAQAKQQVTSVHARPLVQNLEAHAQLHVG